MKFAYYAGCTAWSVCKELDKATRLVCGRLGIELVDFDWTCCGLNMLEERGPELPLGIHGRIFALAEAQGLDVMTICNTCQLSLGTTHRRLREEPSALETANRLLGEAGLTYRASNRVRHLLWVLLDELGPDLLQGAVTRPLTGLRVGAFYGCHILRPPEAHGYEDAERPQSLETIIRLCGAEPVDYAGRLKCCGFHFLYSKESSSVKMGGDRLAEAVERDIDLLVTPCPLCHIALDMYQGRAEALLEREFGLPVLHLPQFLGLAMGLTPEELELRRHLVPVAPALEGMGLRGPA